MYINFKQFLKTSKPFSIKNCIHMYYLYLIFFCNKTKNILQLIEQRTYQEPQFCRLLLKIPWWFPCEPGWAVSAFSELPCSRALVSSLILQYLCPPLPLLSLGRRGEGRLDGAVHKHLLTLFRNCLHIWINNLWKKSLIINGLLLKLHFFIVLQVHVSALYSIRIFLDDKQILDMQTAWKKANIDTKITDMKNCFTNAPWYCFVSQSKHVLIMFHCAV